MKCAKPIYIRSTGTVGCGQCMPCRINQQREVTARMLLESAVTETATFLTLTYNEEFLPRTTDGDATLKKRDLVNYFKRLRHKTPKIRYFACGEYGDQTQRPHYHAIVFGIGPEYGPAFEDAWKDRGKERGFTYAADVSAQRCAYVAGYVTKKMTKPDDERLYGREPEFNLRSRNPGLGAPAVKQIAEHYRTSNGAAVIEKYGDISRSIRVGGKMYPLGRYMLTKIRAELGIPLLQAERDCEPYETPTLEEVQMAAVKAAKIQRRRRSFASGRL
jgi:hypothetical protein